MPTATDTATAGTDLAAALMVATTYAGEPVASVAVRLRNGRTVVVEVPEPAGEEDEDERAGVGQGRRCPPAESLTDMQQAVLQVVRAMQPGTVMTTDEIARKAGFSNSGKMREFLKSLGIVDVSRQGVERLPLECPLSAP